MATLARDSDETHEQLAFLGVGPGVCPLSMAARQRAPGVTLPVLQNDSAVAGSGTELSFAGLQCRVLIVGCWGLWSVPLG